MNNKKISNNAFKASDIHRLVELTENYFHEDKDFTLYELLKMDQSAMIKAVRSMDVLKDKPRLSKLVFEGIAQIKQITSHGGKVHNQELKALEKVFSFKDVQAAISEALQAYNKKIGYDPISMNQKDSVEERMISGTAGNLNFKPRGNGQSARKTMKPDDEKRLAVLKAQLLTTPLAQKQKVMDQIQAIQARYESKELSVYVEIDDDGKITRMDTEAFRKAIGGPRTGFAQDWVDKYNKEKGKKMARLVYAKNGKEIGRTVKESKGKWAKLAESHFQNKAKYESRYFNEGKEEIALAIKEKMKAAKSEYNVFPNEIKRNLTTGEMVYLHYSRDADMALANPNYGMRAKIVAMTNSIMVLKINPAIVNNKEGKLIDQHGFLAFPKNKKIRGLASIYVYDFLAGNSTDANLGLVFIGSMSSHLIESVKRETKDFIKGSIFAEDSKLNEGGPGSGGANRPLRNMKMPLSPFISVGTRKGILQNMPFDLEDVPLNAITHVAQRRFVPSKVSSLVKNADVVSKKPVCLLKIPSENCYHVMDGHHRFLAAQKLGLETIPARVWVKFETPLEDEASDELDGLEAVAIENEIPSDTAHTEEPTPEASPTSNETPMGPSATPIDEPAPLVEPVSDSQPSQDAPIESPMDAPLDAPTDQAATGETDVEITVPVHEHFQTVCEKCDDVMESCGCTNEDLVQASIVSEKSVCEACKENSFVPTLEQALRSMHLSQKKLSYLI
jgi:uncharacterized ParB-like nuclease family protein